MKTKEESVSLLKYFDMRIDNIQENTKIALASANRRLSGMNEFRATLKDQANTFATRQEVEREIERIEQDIKMLTASKNLLEGKASQKSVTIAYIISLLSLLLSIISVVFRAVGI